MFYVVAFLIFTAALWIAAHFVWTVPGKEAARRLDVRLRELRANARSRSRSAPELLRRERRGRFAFVGDLVTWVGILRRLQELIDQADLRYRAADVFGVSFVLALGVFLVLSLIGSSALVLKLLIAIVVGIAPLFYIVRVRAKRLKRFEEQLPDAIDLFTRTMRAGHNIHSGLETIAHETADPVRMEFRKLMEELALGSQVEPALHGLGRRVPLIDLKFFITTLILQRQTGANMVAVLENLSQLVRERLGMAAKLKAHTAQQRFSAGILCALPIVFGVVSYFIKPDYVSILWTDPAGSKILTAAVIWEIIGILIIRKVATIRV